MGWPSHRPRCLEPMEYRRSTADPDPVCWRPKGHERGGTRAALRHLSRVAYLNELARSQKNRQQWPKYRAAA